MSCETACVRYSIYQSTYNCWRGGTEDFISVWCSRRYRIAGAAAVNLLCALRETMYCVAAGAVALMWIFLSVKYVSGRTRLTGVGSVQLDMKQPCIHQTRLEYSTGLLSGCWRKQLRFSMSLRLVWFYLSHSLEELVIFGRPFVKRYALCYRTVDCLSCPVLSCLSVVAKRFDGSRWNLAGR